MGPDAAGCAGRQGFYVGYKHIVTLMRRMGITIPMKWGFVYLRAVVDWASYMVLSHRVSITMDISFCLEALEKAFTKYDKPDYFNLDQGSPFTSLAFTDALKEKCVQIRIDGKGCWRDNRRRGNCSKR